MWRHDQNIDALGQEVVTLFGLHRIVAVGDLNFTVGAGLFAALFDEGLVALPAFFLQRVHRKPDPHRSAGFSAAAGVAGFRALHTSRAEKRGGEKQKHQFGYDLHFLAFLWNGYVQLKSSDAESPSGAVYS